jgi:tRNA(adenine34) deaminase
MLQRPIASRNARKGVSRSEVGPGGVDSEGSKAALSQLRWGNAFVYARVMPAPRRAGSRSAEPVRDPSAHEPFMRLALLEARKALQAGEVPVGAVLVQGGDVVAAGFNHPIGRNDPTGHAEVLALRRGGKAQGNYRLPGATLYVTIEPCLMCVGALINARVAHVVFGAREPKTGAIVSILESATLSLNHRFQVTEGILEDECREVIRSFFEFRRGQP